MGNNIAKRLITKEPMTNDLLVKWNSVILALYNNNIVRTLSINTATAEKYRGDLIGLFRNELSIPDKFVYPHIRVNGFDSSTNYNGDIVDFKILDENVLNNYYKLFTK